MNAEPFASTIRSYSSPNCFAEPGYAESRGLQASEARSLLSGVDGLGRTQQARSIRGRFTLGGTVGFRASVFFLIFWAAGGALALGPEGGWVRALGPFLHGAGALLTLAFGLTCWLQRVAAPELERYTVEEKIGEGAMGEIFRARDELMGRPTAIKIMRNKGSRTERRHFEREIQLTARLTHPNTISVYDSGSTLDGRPYYAMELLEGLNLEQLVESHGPLPAGRVIHLLLQACGALNEAHALGLIHCDIKPANIYVCSRAGSYDVVKVLDFGLVRELDGSGPDTGLNIDAIQGTPLYLSPEAIRMPASLDARADIYALGSVGYFLLCGRPPFAAGTLTALCDQHLHGTPEPPSRCGAGALPADLENVVLQCLAKDPARRPQTTLALAERLRDCRDAGSWTQGDAASACQLGARAGRGSLPGVSLRACPT